VDDCRHAAQPHVAAPWSLIAHRQQVGFDCQHAEHSGHPEVRWGLRQRPDRRRRPRPAHGLALGDSLRGLGGDDVLIGLGGAGCLTGGTSNDSLRGDAGVDRFDGGAGNDAINSRETVNCGLGRQDRVTADRVDRVIGCEIVRRG
jgi:hypothetical protein